MSPPDVITLWISASTQAPMNSVDRYKFYLENDKPSYGPVLRVSSFLKTSMKEFETAIIEQGVPFRRDEMRLVQTILKTSLNSVALGRAFDLDDDCRKTYLLNCPAFEQMSLLVDEYQGNTRADWIHNRHSFMPRAVVGICQGQECIKIEQIQDCLAAALGDLSPSVFSFRERISRQQFSTEQKDALLSAADTVILKWGQRFGFKGHVPRMPTP